jgi:hypothetical protein
VRMYYMAEEFCRGPPLLPNNPMGYDEVRLNLPGADDYTPTLPRVIKWNRKSGSISGDVVTFVDDLRGSGHSLENSWQVSRQLSARMQYLGINDDHHLKLRALGREACFPQPMERSSRLLPKRNGTRAEQSSSG